MFVFNRNTVCLINFLNFRASSHLIPRIEPNGIKTQDNKTHSLFNYQGVSPSAYRFNFHYLLSSVYQNNKHTQKHTKHAHAYWTETDRHTQTLSFCKKKHNGKWHSGIRIYCFLLFILFCPFKFILSKLI